MRDLAVTTRVPWVAAVALCVAGMRAGTEPAIPSGEWISIARTRGVHESVVAVAGLARARGLVPVLYLRTDFSASAAADR
jgi:hypothetical protein